MKDCLIQGTDKPVKNERFDKLVKHCRKYNSYFESTSKAMNKCSSVTKSNMDKHIDSKNTNHSRYCTVHSNAD